MIQKILDCSKDTMVKSNQGAGTIETADWGTPPRPKTVLRVRMRSNCWIGLER